MFSLTQEVIDLLLDTTLPSFQLTSQATSNLGFGFLFYGLARCARPQRALVVGSKAGFAPVCFALGLKDNEGHGFGTIKCYDAPTRAPGKLPTLHFVDPSYSMHRDEPNHHHGIGTWDDPEAVAAIWRRFGVEEIVTHFKLTSAAYLEHPARHHAIDLLYIDGDHSYNGFMHDLRAFRPLLSEASIVVAHDVHPNFPDTDGYAVLCDLPPDLYEFVRIPLPPGLAVMRPRGAAADEAPCTRC